MTTTWHLSSSSDNNYQWEISPQTPNQQTPNQNQNPLTSPKPSHFPSFHDVVLQGSSVIFDDKNEDTATPPTTSMFKTGLGSSVVVNKASIAKASSVFNDDCNAVSTSGSGFRKHTFPSPNSMFQTGSGKKVQFSSAGYRRAKALLGEDVNDGGEDEYRNVDTANPRCPGNRFTSPDSLFQTGSGKKVNVSSEGLRKAKTLLGGVENIDSRSDYGNADNGNPCFSGQLRSPSSMFQTGSGKKVNISSAGLLKAEALFGGIETNDGGSDFSNVNNGTPCFSGQFTSPNSMFQTGSGKKVKISTSGFLRAEALLGGDENINGSTSQGFNFVKNDKYGRGRSVREVTSNHVSNENRFTKPPFPPNANSSGNKSVDLDASKLKQSAKYTATKESPIKFHSAGGRSVSVSSAALQRARSLLGNPDMDGLLNKEDAGAPMFSLFKNGVSDGIPFNGENGNSTDPSPTNCQSERNEHNPKIFVSPLRSSFSREAKPENLGSGTNLMSKFDEEASICKSTSKIFKVSHENIMDAEQLSLCNGKGSGGIRRLKRSPRGPRPLTDITNIGVDSANKKGTTADLKRYGRTTSVSPFKRPRNSKFVTPMNYNLPSVPIGLPSNRTTETSCSRKSISSRFPTKPSRIYVKDFFEVPPTCPKLVDHLPEQVRLLNPVNSQQYVFSDGSQMIGVEAFYERLTKSGASTQLVNKEWVANHYKWIVWKLASYERCYSGQFMTKFLSVSNVLEELKYRYEREVNHGQRSAIKKILEGDASPSSMLVLCISTIYSDFEFETPSASGAEKSKISRVELTDGWYSIDAQLDALLTKQLAAGKLFVGQKLRICGASLNGWNGPASPLEASSTVSLLLHINGTYRAGWAERLGFYRGVCAPLAFRCVKSNGGPIPRIILGVSRIYPVLYRERLKSGGYIVRSEKMEAALAQLYNQRRSNVIEAITSDFQRGGSSPSCTNDHDSEEGAQILKMLETAAEPELLMAEMSSEQLASFSMYREKLQASRECDLQRSIETALKDADIHSRDVTPFMRVRVVGLTARSQTAKKERREGLITIWNPTERQKLELTEGQAYVISGLVPLHSDLCTLYLQARGSSTIWQPLTAREKECFLPFFDPRKPAMLSRIGEIPLSSEFDTAAYVLHVGLEYVTGSQKKQWVFVTDGSLSELQTEESDVSVLAISFCLPYTKDDSVSPINYNLVGSIIGFCNLVKRAKDQVNHMWVAEATENSTYYLNYDNPNCSHLKNAFAPIKKWEQSSRLMIDKLRKKVLHVVGGSKR